ncbi:MAG: hypothetical protein WA071_04420 [Undibacterium umbellatum]|uniref:hypothetical protein n=1 Tax=Undibacterium umbellatum TaxID=2762300 RepID=UPI003BB74547
MRINIIALATVVAGMFSLSGCIVAPTHGHGYGHRHGYGSGVYVSPPPIIIHRGHSGHSGSRWGGRHWRRW